MATDFEIHVMETLADIKQDVGEMKGDLVARVGSLESSHKRQWWFSMCIAPALAILHGAARKFGVNV
jgi:hypothetical protein